MCNYILKNFTKSAAVSNLQVCELSTLEGVVREADPRAKDILRSSSDVALCFLVVSY